jgi:hypothetical protein
MVSTIRILFPDQYLIQALFGPLETVGDLLDFLKKNVVNPDIPGGWYIFETPPKKTITLNKYLEKSLFEMKLVPSARLFFSFSDKGKWDESKS